MEDTFVTMKLFVDWFFLLLVVTIAVNYSSAGKYFVHLIFLTHNYGAHILILSNLFLDGIYDRIDDKVDNEFLDEPKGKTLTCFIIYIY